MNLRSLFLTLGIAGVLGAIALQVSGGRMQRVLTQEEATEIVREQLLKTKDAQLVEKDCKIFDGEFTIGKPRCFLSKIDSEDLLPIVMDSMGRIGKTPGWREDYAVWGGNYTMNLDRQRTFGVILTPIAGNRDLTEIKEAKGFKTYLSIIVESSRSE